MHVVVTGANGFIGRSLATRLRERGDTVVGVDLHVATEDQVVAGDVSNPGEWQRSFTGADLVVHTAALVSNVPTLAEAWRVNVRGTRNVLDAAVLAGVSRFVHISSVRVFSDLGFPDGVTEAHPVRPDGNPYVDTRVASEQVVLQAHAAGEIAVTIVRPGDVYGPGSRPWTVLPVELIKKNRFLLPAMGRGVFSPVYVDDLLDGVLLAADSPAAVGQVYTVGGAAAVTCREFFGHYYRMLGKHGPIVVPTGAALAAARAARTSARLLGLDTELNTVTVRYLCRTGTYSIAKAQSQLGYQPRVDLSVGMDRTRAWLTGRGLL